MQLKPILHYLTIAVIIGSLPASAADDDKQYFATGTGFFVSKQGYVLTANHVIEHCKGPISLHTPALVIRAEFAAADNDNDLALLKIVPDLPIENVASFPAQKQMHKGDAVVVAGYPSKALNEGDFPEFLTNRGKITGTEAHMVKSNDAILLFNNIIEPGYSGGPVLDQGGNIVGVTLAGTCVGDNCRSAFQQAMSTSVKNLADKRIIDENFNQFADTSIAASLPTIEKFLDRHHIPYEHSGTGGALTEARIQEIGKSIVNVRCPALENDLLSHGNGRAAVP